MNVGKTLSPSLRVDGGVNYEFSNLKVSGDATAQRTLKFLKPNLTLDWKPGGGWHSIFSVRRTVAQLNFYDFISFGELSINRVTGSNADLQPQRAWEFRATVEHPVLGDGLFKLDVGHDRISKLQDHILIFDNAGKAFDALGNLGSATRTFCDADARCPARHPCGRASARSSTRPSSVRVSTIRSAATPASFSGFFPDWQWEIDVRRDAGRLSYGFDLSDRQGITFYRTDEFDTNLNKGAYLTAFVEYRPSAKTAITFSADNLLSTHAARDRLLFFPNRAQTESLVRGISRSQPPSELPDHPQAKLRRCQHQGRRQGQMSAGVAWPWRPR